MDVYGYLAQNRAHLGNSDRFVYPPLSYFFLGSINVISGLVLGPDLYGWLSDWGSTGYLHPRMFEFMLILKLPYLLMDLSVGYLIWKYLEKSQNRELALALWFFNPLSLYAIYVLSQFDIVGALLTMAALILVTQKKLTVSAFLIGLGVLIKSYPLFLLPFIYMRIRSLKQFLSVSLATLIALALPLMPVINSPDFIETMRQSNLMQRIFIAALPVGGAQAVPLYIFGYTLVLWQSWKRKEKFDLLPEFLTTTFLVLLLAHFHAQWVIWSLPFLIIVLAKAPRLWPAFVGAALALFITNLMIADSWVFLATFSPVNNHAVMLPPLTDLIHNSPGVDFLQSLAHTFLAATGLYIIGTAWKDYA